MTLENLGHGFDGVPLFEKGSIMVEAGTRLAIIGENGVGKTTLLRCLMGELAADKGRIKWAENATPGLLPQDSTADFDATSTCSTG